VFGHQARIGQRYLSHVLVETLSNRLLGISLRGNVDAQQFGQSSRILAPVIHGEPKDQPDTVRASQRLLGVK
jgi:hypothetical protein